MKALFIIVPSSTPFQTWYPPLGIGYLSSYLQKHNVKWTTSCCDMAQGESPFADIKKSPPDVIALTCTTLSYGNAVKVATKIRNYLGDRTPIILGGQHISALPHTLPKVFDSCVVGEGERAFWVICDNIQKGRPLKRVYSAPKIEDLNTIPFPDRDMFNMKAYLKPQTHWVGAYGVGTSIFTSRGCLYDCVFCSSTRFWGKPVRGHSAEYVIDEMEMLKVKYKIKYLNVFDDLFQYSKKRLRKLVKLSQQIDLNLEMAIQAHAPTFDDETAKLLSKLGVKYAGFGLESASPKLLRFLKCGVATVEDARNAIRNARKYDMKVGSGFMTNVPSGTPEDYKLNDKFIAEQNLDSHRYYILTPYPGTPLWNYAKKRGLVNDYMDFTRVFQNETGNNVKLAE